jgi:hypothetical protein
VILVLVRQPALQFVVRVELWRANVQIPARIVNRLRPDERPEELQTLAEPALVLRLRRVIVRVSAVVLNRHTSQRREGRRASPIRALVRVVVPGEMNPAVPYVRQADRGARANLPLDLQVPLAHARCGVVGQQTPSSYVMNFV